MIRIGKAFLALVLPLAGLVPGAAFGQNIAHQIQICNDRERDAAERIAACGLVIESGRTPDPSPFLMWRGSLYFMEGMRDEGQADFDAVLAVFPDESGPYFGVGLNFVGLGEHALALAHYDEAIRLDPEIDTYHNNKAWLLATASADSIRDGPLAVATAMRAVELNDIGNNHDTLAAAYAEAGDFARAVEEQELAIRMFEDEGYESYIPGAERRLELYRQNMPYREGTSIE